MKESCRQGDPDSPVVEIKSAQEIFSRLKEEMPRAVSAGLHGGFIHILCNPAYEALNPGIYENPLPHLQRNKLLISLLRGNEHPDMTLEGMLQRIREIHSNHNLMDENRLRPEYANMFRYIVGILATKTLEVLEHERKAPLSSEEKCAVIDIFHYVANELGADGDDDAGVLAEFLNDYEHQTILHPSVQISASARRAVHIIMDAYGKETLNIEQLMQAIHPALRAKLAL